MKPYYSLFALIISVTVSCCTPAHNISKEKNITVSIPPIKHIVELLADNDFDINVLVPDGASPETYEPTHDQMASSRDSFLYINTGLLDFEYNISQSILDNAGSSTTILKLDKGIDLIYDNNHQHAHQNAGTAFHGADPHIWLSPVTLKVMIKNVYECLHDKFPDSTRYTANYNKVSGLIDSVNIYLSNIFSSGNRTFIINHPALSYLARDYDLTQIAIENDGKEPSVSHTIKVVDEGRNAGTKIIINQKRDNTSAVRNIAGELGAEIVIFDPLEKNTIDNILNISYIIANNGTDQTK